MPHIGYRPIVAASSNPDFVDRRDRGEIEMTRTAPITSMIRRSSPVMSLRLCRPGFGAAECLMQRRGPMAVGMPLVYEGVSCPGNSPPLRWIAEPCDRFGDIGEISVESNVVLIGRQNAVVPTAQQDLACFRPCGIEMAGRNAFRINRAARAAGKEAGLDVLEAERSVIECFVTDWRNRQQHPEPSLDPIG